MQAPSQFIQSRFSLRPWMLTLAVSVLLVAVYNMAFWRHLVAATGGLVAGNLLLYAATFVILVLLLNVTLTLLAFRPLLKPVIILLLCVTSLASYFMNHYGIVIDAAMIQNVFETDPREASELFNWKLAATFLLLGLLPSVLVWRVPLRYASFRRETLSRGSALGISLAVAVSLLLVFFKTFAPTFREHRELRFLLTPLNYIQATNSFVKRKLSRPLVVAPLGTDAVRGPLWAASSPRRTVMVIVVGETARAMNFSLNGYARQTNPELARQDGLVNFREVYSCGTATAVSVPCVFSALGRADYSESKAKSQQGLLDVLSHAGMDVLWRDNNSGCKGVCDRVRYEDYSSSATRDAFCVNGECYDERMLEKLPEIIRDTQRDMVIVLHQKGSHGPAYAKRYPEGFGRFGPVCDTNDLAKCSTASIVAAYDNTILYTDHFISRAIDMLRAEKGVDTALMYFSDHGESLGENNMYLHGAPYMIAPVEQRHVPFMLWMSRSFGERYQIDGKCLAARSGQTFSHDNVFHTVLGMLNVQTAVYSPALDMVHACRHAA